MDEPTEVDDGNDERLDRWGKDMADADYVCPQCGPDPRGGTVHAEDKHTWHGTDRLDEFFGSQAVFQRMLGNDFTDWDDEQRITFIKDMVLACTDELHEAMNETSWKPWTHGAREISRAKYVKELIDAFHFLLNLMLVVGMTSEELTEEYRKKMEINIRRQQEGYDGKAKCAHCRRSLDELPPTLVIHDHGHVFDSFGCRDEYNLEHPAL